MVQDVVVVGEEVNRADPEHRKFRIRTPSLTGLLKSGGGQQRIMVDFERVDTNGKVK